MLPISMTPEPAYFNNQIRTKGNQWLAAHPQSKSNKYPPYWQECLEDLYDSYGKVCAYYAIRLELVEGSVTVDHYQPKSRYRSQVYEWQNYRLSCVSANRRKYNFEDVYDPTTLPTTHTVFELDPATGRIELPKHLTQSEYELAEKTIKRLQLNSTRMTKMRIRHLNGYLTKKYTADYLKEVSPFVWFEAKRQNLL